MKIIKAYATKNDCYKEARAMKPQGIVVHSTGCNNPYLKRYVDAPNDVGVNPYGNTWNNSGLDVCVHSFIGLDKNSDVAVANILPYNYCAWGVGSGSIGSYNYNPAYIQFEMCEDNLNDKNYYNAVINKAIEYCAYLCKTYNISVDKICSHKEAHSLGYGSDHGDPENWMNKFGDNMNNFRNKVKAKINNTVSTYKADTIAVKPKTTQANTVPYIVKINVPALNIRKGPSIDYGVVGCIKDMSAYTIVQEGHGKGAKLWGKLKSGAGWIALDYTTYRKNV